MTLISKAKLFFVGVLNRMPPKKVQEEDSPEADPIENWAAIYWPYTLSDRSVTPREKDDL